MSLRDFRKEYQNFVLRYVLPLMGLPQRNRPLMDTSEQKTNLTGELPVVIYDSERGSLTFTNKRWPIFGVECVESVTEDTKRLAENLCRAFFKVSPYHPDSFRERVPFYSQIHREKIFQLAVQRGICTWLFGSKNDAVEELMDLLEKWAVQTYEGKKVTFGFVISPKAEQVKLLKKDWFKFLGDDYAAVLTDCIHSVIQLDKECNFVKFLSLTENDGAIPLHKVSSYLPLRFSQCIHENVHDGAIGIFLLNNGDIVLSKDRQIKFVKRNLRWLNFSFEAFRAASCSRGNMWDGKLLHEIYATMLDVSFAHTGGILAVVMAPEDLWRPEAENGACVLKAYDNLRIEPDEKELGMLSSKDKEIVKIKRQVLNLLIAGKAFPDLDRKLRSELTAMDGACILSADGTAVAFGAIIRSDPESSGGARGAACRTLSHYGMAIKISTDGYVEMYLDREKVMEIK